MINNRMISSRIKVAIVGAGLMLGGLIGLPQAFGVPPDGVPPRPSDPYFGQLVECYNANLSEDACCQGVALTNAHEAIACILSACGPGCIAPQPPGSIASVTEFLRLLFGVGPDSCNPCLGECGG
jgi:hypothetical protein